MVFAVRGLGCCAPFAAKAIFNGYELAAVKMNGVVAVPLNAPIAIRRIGRIS